MTVNNYLWITTILFLWLAVVWSKGSWKDTFLKVIFWMLTGWSAVLLLLRYGYWAIR